MQARPIVHDGRDCIQRMKKNGPVALGTPEIVPLLAKVSPGKDPAVIAKEYGV